MDPRIFTPSLLMTPIKGAAWIVPALSLPHIFYYFLWNYPERWIAASSKETNSTERGNCACALMANTAHFLKLVQSAALSIWIYSYTEVFTLSYITSGIFSSGYTVAGFPVQVFLGIGLVIIGQVFNVAIYKAIGRCSF